MNSLLTIQQKYLDDVNAIRLVVITLLVVCVVITLELFCGETRLLRRFEFMKKFIG